MTHFYHYVYEEEHHYVYEEKQIENICKYYNIINEKPTFILYGFSKFCDKDKIYFKELSGYKCLFLNDFKHSEALIGTVINSEMVKNMLIKYNRKKILKYL